VLVVNQGLSRQFHIFRGAEACNFIGTLDVVQARRVLVKLPGPRFERGLFFMTKARTLLLVLHRESLDDATARRAFRQVSKQFAKQFQEAYGRA
jgi:hypothetical protein